MSGGQLATVGFAGVGFALGGPTGAAVGWMVGSWLFAEKMDQGNEIIEPGAQELPGGNQSLRGSMIPVLFGTNRCESYHTWRKNFTPVRNESKQESGAGGKSGGSGGGGKSQTGGGQAGVSYTYKLDCMYHIGITEGEYFLYGGWVGPERLNDQTIAAIGQGFGSNALTFGSDQNRPREASLEFAESYYYPGGDTLPGWTYFLEQENIPVSSTDISSLGMRWKESAWVGMRELNLGNSPNLPMVQWEIGPGGGDLDLDDGFVGLYQHGTTLAPDAVGQVSANGKWYSGSRGAAGDIIWGPPDATSITRYGADIGSFVTTALQNSGIDHGIGFGTQDDCMMIPGTNYVLCHAINIGTVTRTDHGWCLIDLSLVPDNTNPWSQSYVVGTIYRRGDGLDKQYSNVLSVFQMGLQEEGDMVCQVYINFVGGDNDTRIQGIASITEFKADTDFGTSDTMSANHYNTETHYGDGWPVVEGTGDGHADDSTSFCFAVPFVDLSGGAPAINTHLYWFIPRSTVRNATQSYIAARAVANPDGMLVRTDFGQSTTPGGGSAIDDDVVTGILLDANGTNDIFPFSDEGVGQGGADENNNAEYRPEVHIHKWQGSEAAGGYLLLFQKVYYGSTEGAPFGINNGVRAFMYNPVAGTANQVAAAEFAQTFDTVDDVGTSEGDRYNWFYRKGFMGYSEDTGVVTFWGAFDSLSGTPPIQNTYIVSQLGNLTIGGATDVTPPFIIRKILTSDIYGMGFTDANIDETSYSLAVQYCEANKIKISAKFRREQGYMNWIDNLLSVYNGYLVRREDTIFFRLMDFGATSGDDIVRVLDNDHFATERGQAPVRVVEGAQQDTYNKVRVNFLDRNLEYRQNFVEENDEVDQDFNGIRAREFPAMFVMTENLARNIALRGLWSNLYARDGYEYFVGWKDADLEPGDLVTLVDSFDPKLQGGVRARINRIEEMKPGKWKHNATQEIEYIVNADAAVNSATNNSSGGFRRGLTGEPLRFDAYELPKEFQGANPVLYVGWAQSTRAAGAKLWVSGDGVSYAQASDITPHTLSGMFADALPARPRGYAESNVEVYLFPDIRSAAFDPSCPAYTEQFVMEDGSETQRSIGGTALWVGSEMVAYQGLNMVGSNHYRFTKLYRGWGGTPVADHSSGSIWWRHGAGVFVQGINEDKIGTTIFYKVTPYNFSGWEWPVESVDAKTYQIQGTYFKPQISDCPHVWIDSVDYTQSTIKRITDLTSKDYKLEWNDSSRCEGYGTLGYGFSTYGHFLTDTLSHSWRVEVVGSGDTVVQSTVVTTPFFVYSAGANFADNGAFRENVAFRVTPFHETFGDALVTQVASLEFFS
jgi:hypothetical protein